MVGSMPWRPVGMAVTVVTGKQPFQRVDEIVVGAGSGLDDRDARRGVRDEDVAQPSPWEAQNVRTAAVRSTIRRREVSTSITSVFIGFSLRADPRIDARVYCVTAEGISAGTTPLEEK